MNTQEKIEAGFNIRKIPETQNDSKKVKKDYGNKYMEDRKNLNIRKDHIKQLDAIKQKTGYRSYDNVIKHLCDLEAKVDPAFNTTYRCKICKEEIKDIPKHINVNKFTHKDLCIDSSCKGFIVTSKEIALNDKGFVISNKDKANGTTTANDKNRVQTNKKEEKKVDKPGYRNGVKITDTTDPDFSWEGYEWHTPKSEQDTEEE